MSRGAIPVLVLVGLIARLFTLDEIPHDFHATRQLFSMLMARDFWVSWGGEVPTGAAAAVHEAAPGLIEPPITQGGAALLYLTLGNENVLAVRLVLATLWLTAAWPLSSMLRRHLDGISAAAAVAAWVLLPFGIVASRSFQPDGPALVFTVLAVAAALAYDASPSRRAWWRSSLLASSAVLLKLTAGFFVIPVFLLLQVTRGGPSGLLRVRSWGFVAVVAVPALTYVGLGEVLEFTAPQEGGRIVPSLLIEPIFWHQWWLQSANVIGVTGPLVIVAGMALSRDRVRIVLTGMVVGYVTFGLLFTYHFMTHDYYHLPLVLPWAVSCGVIASVLVRLLQPGQVGPARVVLAALCVALPVADVALTPAARTPAAPPRDWTSLVAASEEAGDALEHSEGVAFWAPHYGKTFQYWGYLAGTSWPTGADLAKERLAGRAEMTLQERFEYLRHTQNLEWFLISNSDLVSAPDPALVAYLDSRYEVERSGQGWVAYRISSSTPSP